MLRSADDEKLATTEYYNEAGVLYAVAGSSATTVGVASFVGSLLMGVIGAALTM